MALQLPWELEEEILSRLPPQSLVRFRTISKQWNIVFNDKSFLKNHMSRFRPQFIFITQSKVYSIEIIDPNSIDPTIELRELPIPYGDDLKYTKYIRLSSCDELLYCKYGFESSETSLWNPWLRQVKRCKYDAKEFVVFGLGYDSSKVYKILGYFRYKGIRYFRLAIYEWVSHALKFIDTLDDYWFVYHDTTTQKIVSLNGNLYWVTRIGSTRKDYIIQSFDFSTEIFKPFCLLPCHKNHISNEIMLAVYKRDRFSLLKQCYVTMKIGIWVTKERISSTNGDDGEYVVWINLMNLSTTNLPKLSGKYFRISYYISDKTIFMCCADDETRVACIYTVREDLCKKIQIDSG